MNELTQERNHMHASIVKSALAGHQSARCMNELTQERSHIHASIVKSALGIHQTTRNLNELTQGRGCIHASIVKCSLLTYQASSELQDASMPALSNRSNMISASNQEGTFRSQLQLLVARNLVCCLL